LEIGFIGLGHMGSGIVHNLLKAGHKVSVYNRTRAKAEAFVRHGATVAESPAEAASCPVVMTMLASDDALAEVVDGENGVLSTLRPGGILVNMSTVSVAITRRLTELCRASGRQFVAAPVFGRPDAAEAAKLFIAIAGPIEAVKLLEPVLAVLGQKTVNFGEDPAHAAVVKISGNFMLQSAIEALAEALALVRKQGVDPAQYLDFMTGSLFNTPVYKGYGGAIVTERYTPAGFAIPLAIKDTRLAIAAAEEVGAPLPLADLIRDRFLIALSRGWTELDQAALGKVAAENAGLPSGA
jgi:3-hydroxyisobutyrate dehydrogenase-like beta-hydroxyacid dehydrogenase